MAKKLAQQFDEAFRDISHKINRTILQAIIGVTLGGQPTPADMNKAERWLHDESAAALGGVRRKVETTKTGGSKKPDNEKAAPAAAPKQAIDQFGADQGGKTGPNDKTTDQNNGEQPKIADEDEMDMDEGTAEEENTPDTDREKETPKKSGSEKPAEPVEKEADKEHVDQQTPEGEGRPLVPTDEANRPINPAAKPGEPNSPNQQQDEAAKKANKLEKMRKFMFRNDRKFNRPIMKQINELEHQKSKDNLKKLKIYLWLTAKTAWHLIWTVLYLLGLLIGVILIIFGIGLGIIAWSVKGIAIELPSVVKDIAEAKSELAQIDKNAEDREKKITELKKKILKRQRLSRFQLAKGANF